MRSASLFSIFGLALSLGAALVACSSGDDDDSKASSGTPSAQGESCARTADCASGLVCLGNVCEKKGSSGSGGNAGEGTGGTTGGTKASGGTGGSTGGTTAGSAGRAGSAGSGTVTPPPVLGGEGESCTRAADCQTGLHCFNQRCVAVENNGAGGEAGGTSNPPPSVRLGEQGETCSLSSDCATGLACLPNSTGLIGVCSLTTSGIQPTNKDCHAECTQAADCCELPPAILTQFTIGSCTDLANLLDGIDCTDPGTSAPECFLQATYCQCSTKNTWECNDGMCHYKASCSASAITTEGCPTYTRSDIALNSTCTDNSCDVPAATPVCTKDTECLNKAVRDVSGDTCSDGECTCYKPEGNCYRKCAGDLDCAPGKVCNAKLSLCEAAPSCTDDATCQVRNHNVKSICLDGGCVDKCATDLDCNPLTGSLTRVCNSDHTCQAIGCLSDDDCSTGPVHMFCTDTVSGSGGTVVSSAVTAGGTQ